MTDGETENFDACTIQNESKYGNALEVALEYLKDLHKMKDTIHIMLIISWVNDEKYTSYNNWQSNY